MRSILYRKFIHINDQILFTVVKRKSNHPRRTKNEHKNLVVVDNIYISKYLQRCVFRNNAGVLLRLNESFQSSSR